MKLAVVCSRSKLSSLLVLRDIFDDLFIESRAWFEQPELSGAESIESLETCLGYSDYVLCIPDTEDFNSGWLQYTLGHQRGRRDRMVLWVQPEEIGSIPEWTSGLAIISGAASGISDFYSETERYWFEETRVIMARGTLEDLNLEVSERAFVETVDNGDRFLLGLFLDAGFSPSTRNSSGVPVLNLAIRSRHFSLVGPLLVSGAELNSVAEDRGTTPLMDAAAGGSESLTQQLIEMNAEMDHQSRDGQTAVTLAVGNGHEAAAIALIKNGADVDARDLLGMSARKYATLYNQAAILEVISTMSA